MVAAAPTICATMRPAKEIQAERTLSSFSSSSFLQPPPLRLRPERTATAVGRSKDLGGPRVPRCPCKADPNLSARSSNAGAELSPGFHICATLWSQVGGQQVGRSVVIRRTRAARCGESSTCPDRPAEARGSSDRCWSLPRSRPSRRRSSGQVSGSRAPVEQLRSCACWKSLPNAFSPGTAGDEASGTV